MNILKVEFTRRSNASQLTLKILTGGNPAKKKL